MIRGKGNRWQTRPSVRGARSEPTRAGEVAALHSAVTSRRLHLLLSKSGCRSRPLPVPARVAPTCGGCLPWPSPRLPTSIRGANITISDVHRRALPPRFNHVHGAYAMPRVRVAGRRGSPLPSSFTSRARQWPSSSNAISPSPGHFPRQQPQGAVAAQVQVPQAGRLPRAPGRRSMDRHPTASSGRQ